MSQLLIIQLFVSTSLGIMLFSIIFIFNFISPDDFLKVFLKLQFFVIIIVCVNIFHQYNLTNLNSNIYLQISAYSLYIVWGPGFIYNIAVFLSKFSKYEITKKQKTVLMLILCFIPLAFIIPFILSYNPDKILLMQMSIQMYLIVPLCVFTQIISILRLNLKTYIPESPKQRMIARFLLLYILILSVLHAVLYLIPELRNNYSMNYLYLYDFYFFIWNLAGIVFSVRYIPENLFRIKKNKIQKNRTKSDTYTVDRDWSVIESLIFQNKIFMNPDLNLVLLSQISGISRNRISYLVNQVSGLNFKDYINTLRINEFKEIMKTNGKNYTILRAAFDAGFNSKAAFYAAFKKITGKNPGVYFDIPD